MQLILSNYGLRLFQAKEKQHKSTRGIKGPLFKALSNLHDQKVSLWKDLPHQKELIKRGWAQHAPDDLSASSIRLRYKRNPLEHVKRLVFEYTTLCQLNCLHCRNGHVKPTNTRRVDLLKEAVDLMLPLGIKRFDFIGGEVTLYGRDWLDVVEHISRHKESVTAVITSGWFLEETNFMAAAVRYKDDLEYLRALRDQGLTHVIFSVDGPEKMHDYWRQFPGLYQRILRGIPKVKEAGLKPRVSLVQGNAIDPWELSRCHLALANALYTFEKDIPETARIQFLLADDMNYVSNFIDIGNGVDMGTKKSSRYDEMPDNLLRCKNFFRPFPSLRIQANGELSLCPLVDAGQGYGNVSEQGFLHVLNHLQDAFVYKLHAENRIVDYRKYLDLSLFGPNVEHVCSLRTVLTLLAREIEASGIDPEKDPDTLRRLNLEVAGRAGFLPASGKTATGVKRPV